MIEEILLNYLKTKLDLPVYTENKNEDEYILIGKSGSSKREHTNSATFFIQSYSTTTVSYTHLTLPTNSRV